MYSTCLFCHDRLGANESIEHFPIGQRLAFDANKGRLWVICPHCSRWNLTPLEERWEALEECERLFRGERLRVQTDEIGLAKLRDGLRLVRVGKPLRPEFAAWRYGDIFGARLRRTLLLAGGGVAAVGTGVALAGTVASAFVPVLVPVLYAGSAIGYNVIRGYRDYFRATHVPRVAGGRPYTTFGASIRETDLAPGSTTDEWVLNLRHALGLEPLTGAPARRALGILLTRVNAAGALPGKTREAAERIATAGGPEAYVAQLAATSHKRAGDYLEQRALFRRGGWQIKEEWPWRGAEGPLNRGGLPQLSIEERLALEMAVHEDDERRALEEEMEPLRTAWRDAEEIASIADDLLTSPEVKGFIRRHRRGS